ncbi:hypothetical protein ACIBI4_00370 [Streptomyces sp. NPDC050418]|uniref:hypothetical protein n=1 Tax=Streptomyces sp. NPDC050418 TaxID=3365612 RepID=UPI00378A88B2
MLRSPALRASAIGVLVGALLGAGVVGWRTDSLPLLGKDPCWGALDETTLSAMFGKLETRVDELTPEYDPLGQNELYGECRILGYENDAARWSATLRMHTLDGLRGTDDPLWPTEFLGSEMVGLGDGLPGMASDSRAWIALPEGCVGKGDEFDGPTVVDVSVGTRGSESGEAEDRAALARAVVRTANSTLAELGCGGTYKAPTELPEPARWQKADTDRLCGIDGLALPRSTRTSLKQVRVTADADAAVRTCEVSTGSGQADLRLTTVADPRLAPVFTRAELNGGPRVTGTHGYGSATDTRAVYQAKCQIGRVTFVIEQSEALGRQPTWLPPTLLPRYVAGEAERVGCAAERIQAANGAGT